MSTARGGPQPPRPAVPLMEHVEDLSTEVLRGRLEAWGSDAEGEPGCCTTRWSPRRPPAGNGRDRSAA